MVKLAFFLFVISVCVFILIMIREPRTLWSGISLLWMLCSPAAALFFFLAQYADRLAAHAGLVMLLVWLLVLAAGCAFVFPAVLMAVLFIEGIRMVRHEGPRPANLLTMAFAVLLYLYLAVWPMIGSLEKGRPGTRLYLFVSLYTVYMLALLAVYLLSAAVNLIHWKKRRGADYILVLGARVIGTRVPPLLAARVDRGIELLRHNPEAVLILSGGQGPGEEICEGEAMARYALGKGVGRERILVEGSSTSTEENLLFSRRLMDKDNPKVILVTTAYHVFRALLLARKQGLRCVGFGAKTTWYFTLNALIREFMGYLRLTWRRHAAVGAVVFVLAVISV